MLAVLPDTTGVCAGWCLVEEDPSCLHKGRPSLVVGAGRRLLIIRDAEGGQRCDILVYMQ